MKDWLDRQAAAAQAASGAMFAEVAQRADEARVAAQQADAELQAFADASRVSNGGAIPDDIVDEQLAAYKRNVTNIMRGH